ncbi:MULTISPECIES: transcriptional regulator [Massilia]|uniref:Helix-turn-helix domain-containing protein n=2 Tax=Massilia TaxID=149698 RepID=A0ABX0LYZ2_9BURK|nr:helix-turn-helix domain-containing protein [Massilia aquatica]NHZ98069.1 Cro/Cl family transcriptional regulator [Massilia sp. CCM 8734]QPI52901.1 helix-turn-helix domain-containing protein [Massilia antarctica]
MNGIDKTIAYFGGLASAARALGVGRYQVVQSWRAVNRVPAEHCTRIEELTGGEIRCEELNDRVDWAVVRNSHSRPT